MYENETSPALPFIYLFIYFFGSFANIVRLLQKRFFFHQFKLLIQKVICRISRFGRNSVLAGILFAQCKRH